MEAQIAVIAGTVAIEVLLYGFGMFRDSLLTKSRPARLNTGAFQ